MNRHPFDHEFRITPEQKAQFQRDGFVKLAGFLNAEVIEALLDRVEVELRRGTVDNFKADSQFKRAKYDFESNKDVIFQLLERRYFRNALTDLVERDLFLTFELCFEIERGVSKGFPWHVGAQSFGYQFAEEFGCTLWAPLHSVDTKGQHGGMAYVPQHVVSGEFVFDQIEPAVVSTLRAKDRAGVRTSVNEYFAMRGGILNSPAIGDILENHRVEDDFEPGDALLFNKTVVHRSVMLGDGELASRAAYVLRFVDAGSRYDLRRAQNLEYPVQRYGKGLFPYRPITRQHIEIAEAGAADGDLISTCAYFSDRNRRMVRREQPPA
ncbi:MAG: phytanoyl-CoA dioxygenase family protein [Acidobacteria bacterium]|nr:phytanoyl-CoA dioxygenase family protein [Acidobacteriota bacterium]